MNEIRLHNLLPNVFIGTEADRKDGTSDIWRKDLILEKERLYLIEAHSGTGKSSLCSFIYGYRTDYQGQILFGERNVTKLNIRQWMEIRQRHISILWQDLRLFPELTAMENITIKNQLTMHQTTKQIDEWFDRLGIADRKDYKVGNMSFGQQQRVAMIRALCQPFDFLFADEPISHLDDDNSCIMGKIMTEEARRQGASVIVTSIGKHIYLDYDRRLKI